MATLDNLEKTAKIISLIAIPLVVGWLGWEYQSRDRDKSLALEYVKLSLQIVGNKEKVDPYLNDWAWETLNYYSTVKMSKKLEKSLKDGTSTVTESADTQWFAVVGSLSSEKEARDLAGKLKGSTPRELEIVPIGIYKTKVSRLFALTIGTGTSKVEALRRTRIARDSGWVSDAFAQKDLEWMIISQI